MRRLILVLTILVALACGPTQQNREYAPISEQDVTLFQNVVETYENPSAVSGNWYHSWRAVMKQRVERADYITVVRFESLVEDDRPGEPVGIKIDAVKTEDMLGVSEKRFSIRSQAGEIGYPLLQMNRDKLLENHWVMLRRIQVSEKLKDTLWHLVPATRDVVSELRSFIDETRGKPQSRRRINHDD